MGNFNRDNSGGRSYGGGNRSFGGGGRNFGGDRETRRPEMHKAVCSNCGTDCELPFKPTGERPVFCRNCFAQNRGNEEGKSFGRDNRDNSQRSSFRNNEDNKLSSPVSNSGQLDAINSKLDRILEMLSPTKDKAAKATQPKIEEIVGNKDSVNKICAWLKDWDDVVLNGNKKESSSSFRGNLF